MEARPQTRPARFPRPNFELLRIFFSLFFFASAFFWTFGKINLGRLQRVLLWFSCDLTGHHSGLDANHLWLNLQPLHDTPAKYFVLLATGLACFAFGYGVRPRASGIAVLICAQFLSYAAAGRSISYDVVSYSFIGYLIAALTNQVEMPQPQRAMRLWAGSASALACVYMLAATAKLKNSGFEWLNASHAGIFLQIGQFRFDTGSAPSAPPAALLRIFSEPSIWSGLLLSGAMLVEAGAVVLPFLGRFSWIYVMLLIGLHLGMGLLLGIYWPPVILLLVILLICTLRLRAQWPTLPWKGLAIPAALMVSLYLLSLGLPWRDRENAALVAPFSQFNMYSWPWSNTPLFYVRNRQQKIVSGAQFRRETRASIQNLDIEVWAYFRRHKSSNAELASFVCGWLDQRLRKDSTLRSDGLQVWVRFIGLNAESNHLESKDSLIKNCDSGV